MLALPELLVSLALVLLLGGAATVTLLPWDFALGLAATLAGCGLAVGLPASLFYHLALRRALLAGGAIPARWWLNPTRHHGAVPPLHASRVRRLFFLGAAGFVVTILGCLIAAIVLVLRGAHH